MSGLWKGFQKLLGAPSRRDSSFENLSLSNRMTLKFVFVGGHKSGKTSVIRLLNKLPFESNYYPTIGIDTHKLKLDVNENKIWLWLWDVSHAELYKQSMNLKRKIIIKKKKTSKN